MADVISTLHDLDPAFRELVGLLYPSEVLSKAGPDGADMHINSGTSDRRKKADNAGRKALAGGLLLGTAAESAGTARAIQSARKAVKDGPVAAAKGTGKLKAFIASPKGRVAEAGVQGANLAVGLAAAAELARKPKPSDTMAKAAGTMPRRPAGAPTDPLRQANRAGRLMKTPGMASEGLTAAKVAKGLGKTANMAVGFERFARTGSAQAAKATRERAATHDAFKAKVGGHLKSVGNEVGSTIKDRARTAIKEAISPTSAPKKTAPGKLLAIGAGGGAAATIGVQEHNKNVNKSVTWVGEIAKVDADKRQVFGWCSISEMNGVPYVDLQGDFMAVEEIEKSAYQYVLESRKGGDMHSRVRKGITTNFSDEPKHTADLIESFVVTPEKLAVMGLERDALPHGWWLGMKVNDDEQWAMVKSGERTGFSVHGTGARKDMVLA